MTPFTNNTTQRSPDSQHCEGSILHAQSKLRSVIVEGDAADRFLHVTTSQQGVIRKTPQPDRQTDRQVGDKLS